MSEITSISVEARDRAGKGAARETRRQGLIPGVIYGNKQSPISIAVSPRVLWAEMNKPGFLSRLFDVSVGGKTERVLCRDVQCHPVSDQPLHVDFLRISAESKVHVHIPVHFSNQDKSTGLKRGGVLNVVAHELEIIAPAIAIPSELVVDLTGLDIGASIHLSTIKLPEGVSVVTHEKDQTIATIAAPTVAAAAEAEEAAAAAAASAAAAPEATGEKPAS
ncbi:50S ribosomal protein L25/general stress protein Ctc [Telmatospirillum siberiense]|uniref:Large ribosomal subunit protein bL25 n=1 Tax=Telmatospirillum siberiense TaxID=382514 RepID=A0A2N3PU46_9PROT|nr:50S ribosomal protein L25/general stress protein Ctc [Telmatospirillum siberiense]PKU23931.1 50S ribosomal protein L25 [Telmatospirillum siberiense]